MFSREQIDRMVRDACLVESQEFVSHPAVMADVCCHVKALASEVERSREFIRKIACRGGDWSYPCLLAHVADFFEITVAQLEQEIGGEDGDR